MKLDLRPEYPLSLKLHIIARDSELSSEVRKILQEASKKLHEQEKFEESKIK